MVKQLPPYAVPAPIGINNHVFEPGRPATFGSADTEKDADHPDYGAGVDGAVDASDFGIRQEEG